MSDGFTYAGGNGDVIDFLSEPYFADPTAFCAHEWSVLQLGSSIAGLGNASGEYEVSVGISAATQDGGREAYRRMADAFEFDAAAGKPAALTVNGYGARAYATAVGVSEDDSFGLYEVTCQVRFVVDGGLWTMEHPRFFAAGSGDGLNYPYDYPYNFGSGTGQHVANPGSPPAPVVITVYGPAEGPKVVIAGNSYEVDAAVDAGGRLVIDGLAKTITLYDAYGRAENAFSTRRGVQREGSGSYVFQRVPRGQSPVSWDGGFSFEARVVEVRSSPIPEVPRWW